MSPKITRLAVLSHAEGVGERGKEESLVDAPGQMVGDEEIEREQRRCVGYQEVILVLLHPLSFGQANVVVFWTF